MAREAAPNPGTAPAPSTEWTFLTNHAHVLMCIQKDPDVRLRDVADVVGITERAAQRIVMELESSGYLERERVGRRNRYHLNAEQPLRHPMDREHAVGELLALLSGAPQPATKPASKPARKPAPKPRTRQVSTTNP